MKIHIILDKVKRELLSYLWINNTNLHTAYKNTQYSMAECVKAPAHSAIVNYKPTQVKLMSY